MANNFYGYTQRLRLINDKIETLTVDLTKILKSYNEAEAKKTLYQTAYEAAENKLTIAQESFKDCYQTDYNNLTALYAPARAVASVYYDYIDNGNRRTFRVYLRIGSCGAGWEYTGPCSIAVKMLLYNENFPGTVSEYKREVQFNVQTIWNQEPEATIELFRKTVNQNITIDGQAKCAGLELLSINNKPVPESQKDLRSSFSGIELLSYKPNGDIDNVPADKYNNAINSNYFTTIATNIAARSSAKYQLELWSAYFNGYAKRKEELENALELLNSWKTELHKMFFSKYSSVIQEGTWISEEYYDDEKYYLDAASTAANSCKPQASYTISALELSQLPEYAGFDFKLGDQTYVEDAEFFGTDNENHPIKEDVVLTEISYNLDSPDKNTIKVQTYKNQFQDLFKKITATVQQVKYASGAYDKTSDLILSANAVQKGAYLKNILTDANVLLEKAGEQTVRWGSDGITVKSSQSNELLRIINSGIFLGCPDDDESINWKLVISSKGIGAEALVSGTLDVGKVTIMNGEEATFRWDTYGLTAYNFETSPLGIVNTDYTSGIRFDRLGIYGFASSGADSSTWHPSAVTQWKSNGATYIDPVDPKYIRSRSFFELTREGLYINLSGTTLYGHYAQKHIQSDNYSYFTLSPLANPIQHAGIVTLGKTEDTIYNCWYTKYNPGTDLEKIPYYDASSNNPKFVKVMRIQDANNSEQFALYDDGTLIANNAVIHGTVYAEGGRFKGDIYADNGYFAGVLKAATGHFSGRITAGSGKIGAWSINENGTLQNGNVVIGVASGNGGIKFGDNCEITNDGKIDAQALTLHTKEEASGNMLLSTNPFKRNINGYGELEDLMIALNLNNDPSTESTSVFAISSTGRVFCNQLLFTARELQILSNCHVKQTNCIQFKDNEFGLYINTMGSSQTFTPTTDPDPNASNPEITATAVTKLYCDVEELAGSPAYYFPRLMYTRQGISGGFGAPMSLVSGYKALANEILTANLLGLTYGEDNNEAYKFRIGNYDSGEVGYITIKI